MKSPYRTIIRDLLPGIVLPALTYAIASRHASTIVALAVAASAPAMDALLRTLRHRRPSAIGLAFIAATAVSVGLTVWFRSPLFVLVKGAIASALLGSAFGISALIGRPLTRTLALRVMAPQPHLRRPLAQRWAHPRAYRAFRALSIGWGLLLLLHGAQQAGAALTFPPGVAVSLEGPVHAALIGSGILLSFLYVRRHHQEHPELGLLPDRIA